MNRRQDNGHKEKDENKDMPGETEKAGQEELEIAELPEEEIIRLKGELEAKSREAQEYQNKYLRACADLENYKKRSEKEKADFMSYANEGLMTEVLPVVDNLERALEHAQAESSMGPLKEGVKLTIGQMRAVLKKFGLEEIKSVGEKFDPAVHHAISHDNADGAKPGTVVREFQKGYFLKGRLLRPAMVSVAKEEGEA